MTFFAFSRTPTVSDMSPGRIGETVTNFASYVQRTQNHWTLAVINFRLERLEYFDSLGSPFGDQGFEVGGGRRKGIPALLRLWIG